jgi:hypothetical protein
MTDGEYKQYTNEARRGIKGEAFFETLIVDHAIPHRIARQNDLGVDFLCEWTHGERPCGVLFTAQVKSTTATKVTPKLDESRDHKNGLDRYTLTGAERVDDKTISYWKGLGLPSYLFYVVEDPTTRALNSFYKRYTPFLDGDITDDYKIGSTWFYKANKEASFRGFADPDRKLLGFSRDLLIDYVRLSYFKGHVVPLIPAQFGFWPFPTDEGKANLKTYFPELIKPHRQKIEEMRDWLANVLKETPG